MELSIDPETTERIARGVLGVLSFIGAYCLVNAIQKLGTANKEIKSEIAAGKEVDQDIANIADVIQLASSAIELVLTV